MPKKTEYLTVKEAALELGCSTQTVQRKCLALSLRCKKVNKAYQIRKDSVQELVDSGYCAKKARADNGRYQTENRSGFPVKRYVRKELFRQCNERITAAL